MATARVDTNGAACLPHNQRRSSEATSVSGTRANNSRRGSADVCTKSAAATAYERLTCTRFRTETCRTYNQTGHCPYEDKCMFAHGEKQLRTLEMNERDGLVSEAAIRSWVYKRRRLAARRALKAQHNAADAAGVLKPQPGDATIPGTPVGGRRDSRDSNYMANPAVDVDDAAVPRNQEQRTNVAQEIRRRRSRLEAESHTAGKDDDTAAATQESPDDYRMLPAAAVGTVPAYVARCGAGWYRHDPYAAVAQLVFRQHCPMS